MATSTLIRTPSSSTEQAGCYLMKKNQRKSIKTYLLLNVNDNKHHQKTEIASRKRRYDDANDTKENTKPRNIDSIQVQNCSSNPTRQSAEKHQLRKDLKKISVLDINSLEDHSICNLQQLVGNMLSYVQSYNPTDIATTSGRQSDIKNSSQSPRYEAYASLTTANSLLNSSSSSKINCICIPHFDFTRVSSAIDSENSPATTTHPTSRPSTPLATSRDHDQISPRKLLHDVKLKSRFAHIIAKSQQKNNHTLDPLKLEEDKKALQSPLKRHLYIERMKSRHALEKLEMKVDVCDNRKALEELHKLAGISFQPLGLQSLGLYLKDSAYPKEEDDNLVEGEIACAN